MARSQLRTRGSASGTLTLPQRLTRTTVRLLAALLVVGVVAPISPAPASADDGGRGFYIPGAFAKVSAGESLTFKAYMDDFTPVPKIYADPASATVCRIVGYDRSSWNLTVEMLNGGTCTIWYEYTTPSVRARSDIPVDPHRRQGIAVEGAPDTVPLSAGQASFIAYSDGDHSALDLVEAVTPTDGHETCRVTGYDRSTHRVSVALLRGVVCNIRLARNQTDAYYASERYFQFNIADPHADQAISWSPAASAPAWGDTPLALNGGASSGLPITYTSSTPNLCTVDGDTLHVVDAGALLPNMYGYCTVTASQAGNDQWYSADPVTRTIQLFPNPRAQTVSWTNDPFRYLSPGGGQLTLQGASASSGRTVSYESRTPHNCTVDGNVVTAKTTYVRTTCTVRATAPGAYGSWTSASADVDITMIEMSRPPDFYTNQLVFPQIADRPIVSGPFDIEAKGSLPVTVYTQSAGVCNVFGRTVTPLAVGTCTLRAIQSQNQYQQAVVKDQSFQITAGQQTLDFPAVPNRLATDDPFTLSASATSGLPVTLTSATPAVCTMTDGEVTLHGAGECTVRAEAGNDRWATVTEERSFQVTASPQTLDFPAVADRLATDDPFTLSASATSGLPVTLTSATPAVCTVTDGEVTLHGAGECTVRAEAGNDRWATVTEERSFAVAAAAQTIQLPRLTGAALSSRSVTVAATSSRGLPVTLTPTTPAVCSMAGDVVTLRRAGTCTVRATQAGTPTVLAASAVTDSFPVWAAPTVPARSRRTQIVTVLGRGESALRVVASTPPCRVSGIKMVLVSAGVCRARVLNAENRVVRRVVSTVSDASPWRSTRQLTRSGNVYFEVGSANLLPGGMAALRSQARDLRGAKLVVVYGNRKAGETASLSHSRARAVGSYLRTRGVEAVMVKVGLVAKKPAGSRNRAMHRRAEVFFLR